MKIDPKDLNYKNITISGKICTGTSTLTNQLKSKLGWKSWSGGEFFRDYTKKHNLKLEEANTRPEEISRKVDHGMRKRLKKEKGLILEAWLSGFVAQGVKDVLKVLLVCTDDLRVDRFVNRENLSVQEAVHLITKREEGNSQKWVRMYTDEWDDWVVKNDMADEDDPIDFWDPRLYDLIIDTYSNSSEETLQKVLNKLGITNSSS